MIWFLAGSETICFILSYRIQPNTYPQCQMDLALAIMHVRAHARQYGIDEYASVFLMKLYKNPVSIKNMIHYNSLKPKIRTW